MHNKLPRSLPVYLVNVTTHGHTTTQHYSIDDEDQKGTARQVCRKFERSVTVTVAGSNSPGTCTSEQVCCQFPPLPICFFELTICQNPTTTIKMPLRKFLVWLSGCWPCNRSVPSANQSPLYSHPNAAISPSTKQFADTRPASRQGTHPFQA